jgi:hypothetical protein
MLWNEFFRKYRAMLFGARGSEFTMEDMYQAFRDRLATEVRVSPIGGTVEVKPAEDPVVELAAQEEREHQICPVHKRPYENLARHMQTEHPDYHG